MRFGMLLLLSFLLSAPALAEPPSRQAIVLPEEGRELVLMEMRQFLEAVQMIMQHALREDMPGVADSARPMGMAAMQGVPAPVMEQLPAEFKAMGRETHLRFDAMANDARDLGDPQHILQQLSDTLQHCNACHRSFQLTPPIPAP